MPIWEITIRVTAPEGSSRDRLQDVRDYLVDISASEGFHVQILDIVGVGGVGPGHLHNLDAPTIAEGKGEASGKATVTGVSEVVSSKKEAEEDIVSKLLGADLSRLRGLSKADIERLVDAVQAAQSSKDPSE